MLWAFLAFALAAAGLMLARDLMVALGIMLVFGFAGGARRTGTVSILQTSVNDAQRGRVMSSQFMAQRVAGGIGTLVIGTAAQHGGLRWPMLAAAALACAAWGLAFTHRRWIAAAFREAG